MTRRLGQRVANTSGRFRRGRVAGRRLPRPGIHLPGRGRRGRADPLGRRRSHAVATVRPVGLVRSGRAVQRPVAPRVVSRVPSTSSRGSGPGSRAGRERRLTVEQAAAHKQRLTAQTRDTSRRGKGSRAQRRIVAARATAAPVSGHVKGLSRTNRVKSRAQQRWAFAHGVPWAHAAAKRGGAYKALPTRVRARAT
jgi:hypothetical protein